MKAPVDTEEEGALDDAAVADAAAESERLSMTSLDSESKLSSRYSDGNIDVNRCVTEIRLALGENGPAPAEEFQCNCAEFKI